MQAQSTNFSQKLSKYNQILSILAICTVVGFLITSITTSAQNSDNYIVNSTITSVSKSSNSNIEFGSEFGSTSPSQNSNQSISRISNQVSNQVASVATTTFVGELDRIENGNIFVSKDNQVKQYFVTNDIKVRRDSMESSIKMLKIGDTLTINQSQDSQKIFSIDAISKQTNDIVKWGIGLVILALAITLLITYLLSRSKKGHILTSTSTKN